MAEQPKGKLVLCDCSPQAAHAQPKIAALIAAAQLPEPEPVPVVSYQSQGALLIVGPGAAAIAWAEELCDRLSVTALVTDTGGWELPVERRYPIFSGELERITGYLGAFEATWRQSNPVDLEACTRCNKCIAACPEQAIGYSYQIDPAKCKDHRECVDACGDVRAIDFGRRDTQRGGRFDLVLDLGRTPFLVEHEPPQGYFAPGSDPLAQYRAAYLLTGLVGEFEKPQFFNYREKLCAHGRSGISGCTQCIDVCSTGAISSAGDHIVVDPHLCMGCGGCTSVCPSGALAYAYPRMADLGRRVKTLLAAYREAGGEKPSLLIHAKTARELVMRLARGAKGLPDQVMPVEIEHIGSLGIDAMLGAVAYGAAPIIVLDDGSEAPGYVDSLKRQFGYAQRILTGLGYGEGHFRIIEARDSTGLEQAMTAVPDAAVPGAALFNWSNDKRTTLDFVFDHLLRHAPEPRAAIPLPLNAPYGQVVINSEACTLCMACAGACPEGALLGGQERPQLRFIEQNCVQCGLCVKTCPEDALALAPRLLLGKEAKSAVVLKETEVVGCASCGKPFATRQIIDTMAARLKGHHMFADPAALARLHMCADCRVIDMMRRTDRPSILESR